MPKPTFKLKDQKSKNTTAIMLLYSCTDGRLKYYTRESIPPADWPGNISKGTQTQISRITDALNKTVESYKVIGEPLTKASLKAAIDTALKRNSKVKVDKTDMYAAMEAVIDKMKAGEILTPKTKKKYSAGSIKNFKFAVIRVRDFDPKLKFSGTTLVTYHAFIKWCHDNDLSTNYIGTILKNWKTLGRYASGLPIFSDPEFKKLSEDTYDISLDETEIKAMIDLKLEGRQDLARDWYVINSYNALRVQDNLKLTDRNIGKEFITIANQKTGEKTIIPIHPEVRKILNKYKGLPPYMPESDINEHIKQVARKAKITETVLYSVTKGGKRRDFYLKKYEMVSNHTARRSLITNMLKEGVPDSIVMKLTGIKSPRTLYRYNKLSSDEAAKIAAGLKFFK